MKFIAIQVSEKPFIVWSSIPEGSFDDPESQYFESDLVLDEKEIPETIYGVCPLKIVSGELVERTESEMLAFQSQWQEYEFLREQSQLINTINEGTFTYDSETFPMDERSRILYNAISNIVFSPDEAIELMASDGKPYTLFEADKANFLEAYYWRLYQLSKPNFPV